MSYLGVSSLLVSRGDGFFGADGRKFREANTLSKFSILGLESDTVAAISYRTRDRHITIKIQKFLQTRHWPHEVCLRINPSNNAQRVQQVWVDIQELSQRLLIPKHDLLLQKDSPDFTGWLKAELEKSNIQDLIDFHNNKALLNRPFLDVVLFSCGIEDSYDSFKFLKAKATNRGFHQDLRNSLEGFDLKTRSSYLAVELLPLEVSSFKEFHADFLKKEPCSLAFKPNIYSDEVTGKSYFFQKIGRFLLYEETIPQARVKECVCYALALLESYHESGIFLGEINKERLTYNSHHEFVGILGITNFTTATFWKNFLNYLFKEDRSSENYSFLLEILSHRMEAGLIDKLLNFPEMEKVIRFVSKIYPGMSSEDLEILQTSLQQVSLSIEEKHEFFLKFIGEYERKFLIASAIEIVFPHLTTISGSRLEFFRKGLRHLTHCTNRGEKLDVVLLKNRIDWKQEFFVDITNFSLHQLFPVDFISYHRVTRSFEVDSLKTTTVSVKREVRLQYELEENFILKSNRIWLEDSSLDYFIQTTNNARPIFDILELQNNLDAHLTSFKIMKKFVLMVHQMHQKKMLIGGLNLDHFRYDVDADCLFLINYEYILSRESILHLLGREAKDRFFYLKNIYPRLTQQEFEQIEALSYVEASNRINIDAYTERLKALDIESMGYILWHLLCFSNSRLRAQNEIWQRKFSSLGSFSIDSFELYTKLFFIDHGYYVKSAEVILKMLNKDKFEQPSWEDIHEFLIRGKKGNLEMEHFLAPPQDFFLNRMFSCFRRLIQIEETYYNKDRKERLMRRLEELRLIDSKFKEKMRLTQ